MAYDPNRVVTLAEAAAVVQDGQTLALGGMTLYRRPVAFVRALLQRADLPHELTLLNFTAGYESDLLVGAGVIRQTRTCYFGLEAFGLAPMFTKRATEGSITVLEETEASLAMGIRAALSNVGFMPSQAWIGTDLPRLRPDVRTVTDPYSGETYMAFPAIHCDVAVLHATIADRAGNARLNKNLAIDRELAYLASHLIITAEQIVDRLEADVDIPAPLTAMVVHTPGGAWPTSCYPLYPVGGGEIMRYSEACAAGNFEAYLEQFVSDSGPDRGKI
ncbi:MAG: CoA transferase subunit A [Anaerolineae bacterium]|nr:CoA transferase subunit A [Anaerolineae bacterium]